MKKLLATLLILIASIPLFAELYVGADLGVLANIPIGDPGYGSGSVYSSGVGADVGATVRWDYTGALGVESGLRLSMKDYRYTRTSGSATSNYKYMEMDVINLYLEVPLLATFSYKHPVFTMSLGLGGYAAFHIAKWRFGWLHTGFAPNSSSRFSESGLGEMDEMLEAGLAVKGSLLFNIEEKLALGASAFSALALTPTEKVYQRNQELALNFSFTIALSATWKIGGGR